MIGLARVSLIGLLTFTFSNVALADTQALPSAEGAALFAAKCKSCHEPAIEHAATRAELSRRSRKDIVLSLTNGKMAPMAQGLTGSQVRAVADYLVSAGPLDQRASSAECESNTPIRLSASDWPALGRDGASSRYQPQPGLSARDVPRLKVKWAFALAGGGQPTVVGDWLFTTDLQGKFYALDAKRGCVRWAIEEVASRTTPMVIRSSISPSGWATFVSTADRLVRAFDAQSGKEIWRSEPLESHPLSVLTGSPVIFEDQIFVPVSSVEESVASVETYPCCTFRGSLVALDLKTGHKQWQTYMIEEPLRLTRKNSQGAQMQGPAGAAIWASPTVDPKRHLVYVVTGDSYTEAPTVGADAVVAIEMKSGNVRWKHQVTAGDNFVAGCNRPEKHSNCPNPVGPDADFGASAVLVSRSFGRQVLVAGQKSGLVHGFDPGTGKLLWTTRVGEGSPLGGVEWGIASDNRSVFVPNSDVVQLINTAAVAQSKSAPVPELTGPGKPGLTAIDPMSGKIRWHVPAPQAPCHYAGDRSRDYAGSACIRAQSAAPAAIPGVVFSGTLDGWLRAYEAATGRIVWGFSTTAQTYDTVNGVKDQPGGGIDGMGPTVAGGMLYTMSGFSRGSGTGGNAVNVLLAFSVDGK